MKNQGRSAVRWLVSLAIVVTAWAAPLQAKDIHVPGDQPTIQDAIDAAVEGDEILVAPGVYFENIDFLGKAIFVQATGPRKDTIIDGGGITSVVRFTRGEGRQAKLKGFTVRNGDERKGGGLFLSGASPVIRGNVIERNHADEMGAGIYLEDGSAPLIVRNMVRYNNLEPFSHGAGIYAIDSSPDIVDNLIEFNWAIECVGGGIGLVNSSAQVEFNNIQFNTLYSGSGCGISLSQADGAILRNNNIYHNLVRDVPVGFGFGGGVFVRDGSPLIEHNWIQHNEADGDSSSLGGGIALLDASPTIRGNVITDNSTAALFESWGGGISISGNSDPWVVHNTFSRNYAQGGAGVFVSSKSTGTLDHCIVWENLGAPEDEILDDSGTLTVCYSDVRGGWSGSGTGNVDVYPDFMGFEDFSLASTSACIDIGNPSQSFAYTDLLGTPRVLDGNLDMLKVADLGAYEFTHVTIEVAGDPIPGGVLTVSLEGTAGLDAYLWVGTQAAELPFGRYGILFFDPGAPFVLLALGTLPAGIQAALPTDVPSGATLIFQGLATRGASGDLSRAEMVVVE